jgi:hypothetical protein
VDPFVHHRPASRKAIHCLQPLVTCPTKSWTDSALDSEHGLLHVATRFVSKRKNYLYYIHLNLLFRDMSFLGSLLFSSSCLGGFAGATGELDLHDLGARIVHLPVGLGPAAMRNGHLNIEQRPVEGGILNDFMNA